MSGLWFFVVLAVCGAGLVARMVLSVLAERRDRAEETAWRLMVTGLLIELHGKRRPAERGNGAADWPGNPFLDGHNLSAKECDR